MKIRAQDRYLGAGLAQIVEHQSFKALNQVSGGYGHYVINADRHLFAKYSSTSRSPWQFTFQPDDLKAILSAGSKTFVMLVCGAVTVCGLTLSEIRQVIDLNSAAAQYVKIEVPRGGSCHIRGSKGKLKTTVPHNAFPRKAFA